jgi:hypothetical protein
MRNLFRVLFRRHDDGSYAEWPREAPNEVLDRPSRTAFYLGGWLRT